MAGWTIRRAADLVAAPWRNGLGTSREIVTRTLPDGALGWQVSIAELVQDAVFSDYPHCERVFTPIAGDPPPELAFDGGGFAPCPVLVPKRFPGDVPTLSRIPAPGRAFNAIADRRHYTIEVSVVPVSGSAAAPDPAAGEVVVYCHSGRVAVGADLLGPGDTAIGGDEVRPAVTGEGTILVVAVRPA